jgi:phosphopentomutase
MINRVILMVMDSVGVGDLPVADGFNDRGAHTLLHVFQQSE